MMLNTFSVAFYNVENLFDFENNAYTLDKDYTPEGEFQWGSDRYHRKIQNLSKVISRIGLSISKLPPIFIGLAEIENETCLTDLISDDKLKPFDYDFVHYDSPDERGIDVAFLYQKEHFELSYSDNYPLMLKDNLSRRDYTRDVLLIHGKLFNNPVYIIVNHWPSRNGGSKTSDYKRVKAAKLIHEIIAEIRLEDKNPNIIIMGDFNDEPHSNSIKNYLITKDLHNPMQLIEKNNKGSVKYQNKWYLFDQIIISRNLQDNPLNKLRFLHADIFNDHFIQESSGKRKGAPKRTFIGKWHLGGFSDHFPVMAYFKINH